MMGVSKVWALGFILINALLIRLIKGDNVTLEGPEQSVFVGDSVTLRCTGPAQRHLSFYKKESRVQEDSQHQTEKSSETTLQLKMSPVSESDEGLFSCRIDTGTRSDEKELKVTAWRRRISLTTSSSIIPLGGSVTLSCAVQGFQGKHQWFRQNSFSDSWTETMSEASQTLSVSEGGMYSCRGRDQFIITSTSNRVMVWESLQKIATLTVDPNRSEMSSGERLTLRCEIEDRGRSQWTYRWRRDRSTLSETTREYSVNSVTASDGGQYSCRGERDTYYVTQWSSDKVIKVLALPKEISSFPVMLVIGPVCAAVLLILLLLLWRHRTSQDRGRSSRPDTGLGAEVQHNQQQLYSSLLHGDNAVYESVSGSRNDDKDDVK